MSNETTQPEIVPVILHEARTFHLSYYNETDEDREVRAAKEEQYGKGQAPIVAKRLETVAILPGLNYVSSIALDRAKFEPDHSNVRCSFRDPTGIPRYEALDLVKNTTSKQALVAWRMQETRAEIIEKIDARLTESRG